ATMPFLSQSEMGHEPFRGPLSLWTASESRRHDAPYHDRPRRLRREEIGQVVHGEARLRNPGPPRPLDHRGPEERERRVPSLRGVLSARARELWNLLRFEGCQEGGAGTSESRGRLHHADDERRLGTLRDVQGYRR